jgi:hypothetical protein
MRTKHIIVIILSLISLCCCNSKEEKKLGATKDQELLTLSFPRSALEKGERLMGFEIKITHGYVPAINRIPVDWSMSVDADLSWSPIVRGRCHHGAGAVIDLSELDSFLTIQPAREPDVHLDIEAVLLTSLDTVDIKTRSFRMPDLIVEKVGKVGDVHK